MRAQVHLKNDQEFHRRTKVIMAKFELVDSGPESDDDATKIVEGPRTAKRQLKAFVSHRRNPTAAPI
jgi:hypothetical protein